MKKRRDVWTTVKEVGYFPLTANDGAAAGNVCRKQVRRSPQTGVYECRWVACNQGWVAEGEPFRIGKEEFDELFQNH